MNIRVKTEDGYMFYYHCDINTKFHTAVNDICIIYNLRKRKTEFTII